MSKTKLQVGISFMGALALLFIGLKLTNHIDWSWCWVLSPLAVRLLQAILAATIETIEEHRS